LTQNTKAHLGLLATNLFFAINYSAIKYFTGHHYAGPFGLNIIRIGSSGILFWLLFLFNPVKQRILKKEIPA
jgi:drug/metabolite transporter (DMT)-like permease